MRVALAFFVAFLASFAHAQPQPLTPDRVPVVIDLQAVSLAQVVHLVYKEISPASYVLAPDLVSDQRPVSLRWTGLPAQLPAFMNAWLETLGYATKDKAGTLFMSRQAEAIAEEKQEEEKETMIYWPRFQSAAALRELAGGVVPLDGFTSRRGVSTAPAPQVGGGLLAPIQN